MELQSLFDLLPSETIVHIIAYFPKRCWFVLSKRLNELAFEGTRDYSKLKALSFACQRGQMALLEKCLLVSTHLILF
jgi:hypothetical protein